MLSRIFILHAKGMPFDGYQIKAIGMESAKSDAEYMFDLADVEYWIEDTKKFEKETKMGKPVLELTGQDGNAYAILGRASRVARKAGWTTEEIKRFHDEATTGDYDHLLQTCMKYFDVE